MGKQSLRQLVRSVIPLEVRQLYALGCRHIRDSVSGTRFSNERDGQPWPVRTELTQIVFPGQLYQNKLSNLRRGAELIDQSLIRTGSHWSFWGRIGKPSSGNGFLEGRNIVDGRLVRQVGGGLCQLSSLIYHLALLGGLQIVERHPHSIDLYREEERFTPLGADATVVWGFKDLRLCNSSPFAISIGCYLDGMRLVGQIRSEGEMPALEVKFAREEIAPGRVRVQTIIGGKQHAVTEYKQRPGLQIE